MKSNKGKIILRYKKEDLESIQKTKSGLLYIDTNTNRNLHCCEIAYVEASNEKLEEQGLYEGSRVLVQYLVDLDTQQDSNMFLYKRNQYFMEEQDGDIIRWCHIDQIFGWWNEEENFVPVKGMVFCELPEKPEQIKSELWTPEQNQDTDNKAYYTTIKYIHPHDSEESGLNAWDRIVADKNSDAVKRVGNEDLLRVPLDMIVALA